MTFKRAICGTTLAAGVGLAGLFGIGLGTASADAGGPGRCDGPGAPPCARHDGWNRGPAPADWSYRGIDQARSDHQPFNWNGQQVTPMQAGNGPGWGFWFNGSWIPL